MADALWYPEVVAVVPRKVFSRYVHEPWSVVIHAAEAGENGLSVTSGRNLSDCRDGFAWLRAARSDERSLAGLSLVYKQNW